MQLADVNRFRYLIALLVLVVGVPTLRAQEVAEYLGDLKQYRITDANIGQFIKGIDAEKKANAASLSNLAKGDLGGSMMGSLMKCISNNKDMISMGECGGQMASEKSPQELASGLDDSTFEGMKQRLWLYFDGSPAERAAQFSAAELAVLDKRRQSLAAYRELYLSPHPDGGGG